MYIKYCSKKCVWGDRKIPHPLKKPRIEKKCLICDNKFEAYPDQQIYCSVGCANKAQKLQYEIGTRKRKLGSDSPGWKGGRSKLAAKIRGLKKYKYWRSKVYRRDNFTCQKCNKRGYYLNADHIVPFSFILKENNIKTIKQALNCKELWDINNGRTLCIKCHKKTDTYGFKAKEYKK